VGTTTDPAGAARQAVQLRLFRLASPALPVGGFSYSEGLESAVEAGLVGTEAACAEWLAQQLEFTLVRSDGPLLLQAHAAWARLPEDATASAELQALNDWLRSTRETHELRAQTEQMGRALLDWLRNGEEAADPRIAQLAALQPAPGWPLAFALAGVLAGASARDTLLAFAHGWCENMVQAAMKAVPLGQAAAQRVLAQLGAALPAALARAEAVAPADRQAFTPMLAILSAQHEVQYSRLFRS
jgi:urease accessory protein